MTTKQIALKPDLFARARERAARLGVSVAEYVERLVARDLGSSTRAGEAHEEEKTLRQSTGTESDGMRIIEKDGVWVAVFPEEPSEPLTAETVRATQEALRGRHFKS